METFSESWYRIAHQKLSLRMGVKVRRQNYRGERWMVLENPFSNQFFRLRPAAYEFVARLRPDRTVEEVWRECLDRFPDSAPGQQAVIQLLAQLYHANLLQYDLAADSARLFDRFKKRKQREMRAKLLSIMFMRIPLIDPDRFLQRTLPVVGKLLGWVGGLFWLAVVGMGLKAVVDNFDSLLDESQSLLSPGNLPLLYLGMVFIKTLHEFGHAYFCRKYGGEVHVMGVMLLIFTPIPYVDATSSWGFRSRWQRMLVGGAGMIVEVFVAAIAVFVWANTAPGTLHNLAYNMIFVASVSTVIFNLNPLLRFDGYYMLSDLLEIPNLHQRATGHLRHLIERYLYGAKQSESPARSNKEAFWLTVFGISAFVYRIVVFVGILLFVADRWLLLGMLMALLCFVSWVIAPLVKFVRYLATSPRLERCRPRAVGVALGFIGGVVAFLQLVPLPSYFRAPGVLEAEQFSITVNESAGEVVEMIATPGQRVEDGEPLMRLENASLELQLRAAKAQHEEVIARIRMARTGDITSMKPLRSRLTSVEKALARLEADRENLTVRARGGGVWVAPGADALPGRWLVKGSTIGMVIDTNRFEFVATVSQTDVDYLFNHRQGDAESRLFGQGDKVLPVKDVKVIPAEQRILPSAALGWSGGGEVATDPRDTEGSRTVEPYFKVIGRVDAVEGLAMLHGRTGKIRFHTGNQPLLPRWYRRLRQLLQTRYQI